MSMNAPDIHHKPPQRGSWRFFHRKPRLNGGYSSPWMFSPFMEEGKSRPGLGHEAAIDTGSECVQLTPPASSRGEPTPYRGVVVQKSVTVMVRDKDVLDDTSKMSCASNVSEFEFESGFPLNDAVVWTDICFKGIVRG